MERIKLDLQKFADNSVEVELTMTVANLLSSLKEATVALDKLKVGVTETKNETKSFKDTAKEVKNTFSEINFSSLYNQIKRLGTALYSNFLTKAIDTSEELNLFNVVFDNIEKKGKTTFSELGEKATKFQNQLNEAFGTNKKETMRYQGLFQAMGESAGLKEEVAALMSENMTKLSYDLASLYNTTETKAAESLRAGVYAGQTKPLRNYGIDVTQTSFKPILDELGIDKSVNELTQAEKEVLRYISTLRQAQNAMGDFANTVESPANQLKVLKQQFYEMQAAIGNLFVGAFARILPYVNAIIMVIKELAKTIASFFGIKMKDYNQHITSYADDLDDYSDSLGGVANSANGASDAIKALKRQTLGFDQINNITSPTPSSGSGGSGGGAGGGIIGGIDDRLLGALKDYENGMENVRMKASQLRDKIMDILGFTKHINEKTGEIYFTYNGWKETVKGIWEWFKELTPLGKTLAGLGLASAFINLYRVLKKIADLTGLSTIFKTLFSVSKKMLTPLGELTSSMFSFAKASISSERGLKDLNEGLIMGVQSWREEQGIIDKTTGKLNGFKGAASGAKNILLGLAESAGGLALVSASAKDAAAEGANLTNVIGALGGTMMSVLGGAQIGAVFGPLGAAIGAVVGALAALITTITSSDEEIEKSIKSYEEYAEAINKNLVEMRDLDDQAKTNMITQNAQIDRAEFYKGVLLDCLDANGRIKDDEQDRAQNALANLNNQLGTTYKIEDGLIKTEDDLTVGREDLNKEIDKTIALLKIEAYLEAYKSEYAQALKTKRAQQDAYSAAVELSNQKLAELDDQVKKGKKTTDEASREALFWQGQKNQALDDYNSAIGESQTVIDEYETLVAAKATNSTEKINEALDKWGNKNEETLNKNLKDTKNNNKKTYDDYYNQYNKIQKEANGQINKIKSNKTITVQADISNFTRVLSEIDTMIGNKKYKMTTNASGNIKFEAYANGGLPSTGQMFIAREAGPELVGRIGNRTAVANNDQIISGIERGVYNAVASAMGNGNIGAVQIDLHTDEGVVVDRINKITRQTGTCPIDI